MMRRSFAPPLFPLFLLASLGGALVACNHEEKEKNLAPVTEELQQDAPTTSAQPYEVLAANSKVNFFMDAELEQIQGRAPESTSGVIYVDLVDLQKTTGLVKIDLKKLSIFQKKRDSEQDEFGDEVRNPKQNEHMQTWLQISDDGPEGEREKNRFAEFKIEKVATSGQTNVAKLKEEGGKVEVQITGTLRLHGRTTEHTFPAQVDFSFQGTQPMSVHVVSKAPLRISLDKHDVRPRSAFNVLADKTLDAMGAKVAKVAEVSLDLEARMK